MVGQSPLKLNVKSNYNLSKTAKVGGGMLQESSIRQHLYGGRKGSM